MIPYKFKVAQYQQKIAWAFLMHAYAIDTVAM